MHVRIVPLYFLAALALLLPAGTSLAQIQGRYGQRGGTEPVEQTVRGSLKQLTPVGVVLDVEGMEVQLPLNRMTEVVLTARVDDPAVVLRPGAIVSASGNLEGPSGPVGTGGLTVIIGFPRNRQELAPQINVGRPQVLGDPPPVSLRGQIVSLAPVVVVAAGRVRVPLRLPEKPDVAVRIYGAPALKLASPGDDVTATIRPLGRPGAFLVERLTIARKAPLTAEDLAPQKPDGNLAREGRTSRRPTVRKKTGDDEKASEKKAETTSKPDQPEAAPDNEASR